MSDWNDGRCYLCGELGADTVDHVPPKGVMPQGYRDRGENLIAVPAHRDCNSSCQPDDDYFISQVAIPAIMGDEAAKSLHQKTLRGLKRPEARGLLKTLYSEFSHEPVVLPDGTERPDLMFRIPDWDRMLRVIARTAKGLYYHKTREVLPQGWPVVAQTSVPEKAEPYLDPAFATVHSFASGSFRYSWLDLEPYPDDPRHALILMSFFDKMFLQASLGHAAERASAA